jgi:hypothetical protein
VDVPAAGLAGTIAWAGGCTQPGLWEESTLRLLHRSEMNLATAAAIATALERADEAADAVQEVVAMDVEELETPVDEQVLVLLRKDHIGESHESLLDRWSGVSSDGVFEGSMLVHVLARAERGRVMGFAKGFMMEVQAGIWEVYLDEVLVGEEDRGQRLLQHMLVALLDACMRAGSKVTRVRLQCVRGCKMVGDRSVNLQEQVYTPIALGAEYHAPASELSPWCGTGVDDPNYIMLHGKGADVREAAENLAASKPLAMGVTLSAHLGGWGAAAGASTAGAPAAGAPAASPAAAACGHNAAAAAPAATLTHRPCRERRLLPPDSPHTMPGGLLEQLEALEHAASSSRLQGTARLRFSQAQDRALLAIADHAIRERENGADTGEAGAGEAGAGEAGADLYTRRLAFFISCGVGLPALASVLARSASKMGKSRSEYVAYLLDEAPDLIEEVRRAARLTACAPRVAVRETDVSLMGSRGEQLLGGTESARAKVLGSEYAQAVRAFRRCLADVEKARARMQDLKEKTEATERLAKEAVGGAAEAEQPAASQPAARGKKRAEAGGAGSSSEELAVYLKAKAKAAQIAHLQAQIDALQQ